MLTSNYQRRSSYTHLVMCLSLVGILVAMHLSNQRAYATADLTQSNPEANATLVTAPTEVSLSFSQGLDPSGSRFTVTGPDGTPVHQGDSQVVVNDQTSMSVALVPDLPDGVYSVQWTTLSAEDSTSATGSYSFTIMGLISDVTVPTTPDTTTTQPDTTMTQPDTTQQPTSPLPVTAGDPTKTPSLALAGCLMLVIAGVEVRRRSRIAAERAAYAQDMQ